jgi:hypothetical protein
MCGPVTAAEMCGPVTAAEMCGPVTAAERRRIRRNKEIKTHYK